jgi:hypothetical protein
LSGKEDPCHKLKWLDIAFLTATGAKILSLTGITWERYLAIARLSTHSDVSTRATAAGVVVMWLLSILYNWIIYAKVDLGELNVCLEEPEMNYVYKPIVVQLPDDFNFTRLDVANNKKDLDFITFCYYKKNAEGNRLQVIHYVSVFLFYIGPFSSIVVMFVRIFTLLWRMSTKVNTDSIHQTRVCTTKAMSAIVSFFLLVWIPGHVFQIEILEVDRKVRERKLSQINFKWRLLHDMALGAVFSESFIYVIVYMVFVHNLLGPRVVAVRKNLRRKFTELKLDLIKYGGPRGNHLVNESNERRSSAFHRISRFLLMSLSDTSDQEPPCRAGHP